MKQNLTRLLVVLATAGCGSTAFQSADDPEVDGAGGTGGWAGSAGLSGAANTLEDSGAAGAQTDAGADTQVPDNAPACKCEHLAYVGSGDQCGPGDVAAPNCTSLGQLVCYRCTNDCPSVRDPDSDAACALAASKPGAPYDSWWCCP